ncbi:hypothetical protein QBC44DRAFT_137859 [Cladorrhinum sp. PSN332]|nr:hypothetical protein QBC44DRAFT_137859 [Cladorrhinum sp. PSN332]
MFCCPGAWVPITPKPGPAQSTPSPPAPEILLRSPPPPYSKFDSGAGHRPAIPVAHEYCSSIGVRLPLATVQWYYCTKRRVLWQIYAWRRRQLSPGMLSL